VENNKTAFTSGYRPGEVIKIPISHGDGNYYLSESDHKRLLDQDRVVFRYSEPDGTVKEDSAPNGSLDNIAGVINDKGNIMGLMPHPERVTENILGGVGGRRVWLSIFNLLNKGNRNEGNDC
jgi:phosphoribosylformylglycinamidine synthase